MPTALAHRIILSSVVIATPTLMTVPEWELRAVLGKLERLQTVLSKLSAAKLL